MQARDTYRYSHKESVIDLLVGANVALHEVHRAAARRRARAPARHLRLHRQHNRTQAPLLVYRSFDLRTEGANTPADHLARLSKVYVRNRGISAEQLTGMAERDRRRFALPIIAEVLYRRQRRSEAPSLATSHSPMGGRRKSLPWPRPSASRRSARRGCATRCSGGRFRASRRSPRSQKTRVRAAPSARTHHGCMHALSSCAYSQAGR